MNILRKNIVLCLYLIIFNYVNFYFMDVKTFQKQSRYHNLLSKNNF